MDISKITAKDWKEFNQKFPGARAFLLERSLVNEAIGLINETAKFEANGGTLNQARRYHWAKARLAELETNEHLMELVDQEMNWS